MKVGHIQVKSIMTKSNLPASDYAVNPYVGCPHKCKYCYACFMKRFTGHKEEWGDFIDIKNVPPLKNPQKYQGKSLFIGSVTDGYNSYEKKYEKTKEILQQLVDVDAQITISTKSALILRDIALLKKMKNLKVAFSLNTVDEDFRQAMDKASPIQERITAMQQLYAAGIFTVAFISPIFPAITNVEQIVQATKNFCQEYWLENLNLRGSYKKLILDYVKEHYPEHLNLYKTIYLDGDKTYWLTLSEQLSEYAKANSLAMINYFYHDLIKKNSKK